VSISLLCAWMNMHGAKNEFHLRDDSNFDEANITNCMRVIHRISLLTVTAIRRLVVALCRYR
jgi:hypothetical protein